MARTGKRNDEEDEYDEYDGEIARGWREGENGDKDITWNGHGIELVTRQAGVQGAHMGAYRSGPFANFARLGS